MSDWMDAEQHADRALEMFERGRWAEAEQELRKAISLNPDHAEWHFNLGLTLEHAGRDTDALAAYEEAIELMPQQAEPLLAAGVVANRVGQFAGAIKHLDHALKLEPTLEEAYAHKIESHFRLGQHDDAETTFYMAQHALTEPSAQCLAVMAESLIQRDLFSRAEWCLREAMRLEPTMPRIRARLAMVFAATGKPQRAVQLYLRELRDDPGNIDTLLEYGSLLHELGRVPEAAEKFRRVLEIEPANADAHFRLGVIALTSHRYEQATMEFELVLKLDSQFPAIRCALGETLLRRQQQAEARRYLLEEFAALKSAFAERSATQVALTHLATLLLDVNEPQRAAELLEAAITLGETSDLLRQLALARYRSGDRIGGAAASRRVLRHDRSCVRSMHNLALAAMEQQRIAVASGWIYRGLKINRHDEGLRRLRIRLWVSLAKHGLSESTKLAVVTVRYGIHQVRQCLAAARQWLDRVAAKD